MFFSLIKKLSVLLFLENLSKKLCVLHIQINFFGEKQKKHLAWVHAGIMFIPLVCTSTRVIYIHSVAMKHQVYVHVNMPNDQGGWELAERGRPGFPA